MSCCGNNDPKPATPATGARMVHCVKLGKELEGLSEVPFDGHPLGQRIYYNVSKEAWRMWVEHMKMLMNEYRLNLGTRQAQEFLLAQMEQYFFGDGSNPLLVAGRSGLRRTSTRTAASISWVTGLVSTRPTPAACQASACSGVMAKPMVPPLA